MGRVVPVVLLSVTAAAPAAIFSRIQQERQHIDGLLGALTGFSVHSVDPVLVDGLLHLQRTHRNNTETMRMDEMGPQLDSRLERGSSGGGGTLSTMDWVNCPQGAILLMNCLIIGK